MKQQNNPSVYFSKSWVLPVLLIALGFVARIVPHAPNATPLGAIALAAGLYMPRRWAVVLPLAAMFASDIIIGFYSVNIMVAVYGSFALMALVGVWARGRKSVPIVAGATLAGSTLFFLATNAAVWAFGTMYPHTISGLMLSYTMGLPFFRNMLVGDMFYVAVLVGGIELAYLWARRIAHVFQER
jgi:hypothetical protein